MNKNQITFWWATFCNSCMCEHSDSCKIPVVDENTKLISNPSNYKSIKVR